MVFAYFFDEKRKGNNLNKSQSLYIIWNGYCLKIQPQQEINLTSNHYLLLLNYQKTLQVQLMKSTPQPQTQQNILNLQCVRYKRITSLGGTLTTFNKHKQNINQIIQFPLIQNPNDKYETKDTCLILSRKNLQQQIGKKTSKSLIKQFEENRKRKANDNMNLLGLDVIKIQCLDHKAKADLKKEDKINTISKISQKMCEIQSQKDFCNEFQRSQKKKSQKISTLSNLAKLQLTDSFVISNKTKSISQNTNSTSLHNSRNTSTRLFSSDLASTSQNTSLINSPDKKISIRKKDYLYKKLQGVQNKKREEFSQVYQRRIKSYLDFLFKVQISYNFSTILDIKHEDANNRPKKLKAYVGPGNNGAMIKGLLKRRFWWTIVDEKAQDCNFVWTQIKINSIFEKQGKGKPQPFISFMDRKSQQVEIANPRLINTPKKSAIAKKRQMDLRDKQKKFFQNNEHFNNKILNDRDCKLYQKVHMVMSQRERQLSYEQRLKYIGKELLNEEAMVANSNQFIIHNHLQNNFYLGNKKALFYNLKQYYQLIKKNPFDYMPLTFHIKNGFKDPQYTKFCQDHKKRSKQIKKEEKQEQQKGHLDGKKKTRNIWIVKPGENSNQGRGITVIDEIYQLNNIIKQNSAKNIKRERQSVLRDGKSQQKCVKGMQTNEQQSTFIVQLYIDRPLLYNNRKFDIRHYMMITNILGITRAYWYEEGYIRTSSYEFNIHQFQPEIHLTNDAVQKNFPDYHRYQPYNKVSYEEFQRYLDLNYSAKKYNFKEQILPKMKSMATDAAKSVFNKISPSNNMNNFEIFGLDFMIDNNFQPWLIQINTNPCLDCACPLLDRIIPYMVEQSFKLTLDTLHPPPHHYTSTTRHFAPLVNLQTFKYEMIFDSLSEGQELIKLYKRVKSNIIDQIGEIQQDETFKDEGKEIKLDDFT